MFCLEDWLWEHWLLLLLISVSLLGSGLLVFWLRILSDQVNQLDQSVNELFRKISK
jgi:hypothetical protein